MSNDRLEPFNYHNIAFKRCADIVSLGRLDRLWFLDIIDSWKLVGLGKMGFKAQTCWTDLLAFWGVWNRSRILNFGPDRLFFRFSRALPHSLVDRRIDSYSIRFLTAVVRASLGSREKAKVCLRMVRWFFRGSLVFAHLWWMIGSL